MKNLMALILGGVFLIASVGCRASAENSKVYYVCNCQDDCRCNAVSGKPGKCSCGTELAAMHVLAVKDGVGIFCRCGADCTCELDKADPEKCGCGQPVKKISLKGKYVCNCGDACNCGSISDAPGKCHCGKDLKRVI